MKLEPILDRVAIKRDDAEEKTKGGILLPQTGKKSNFGEVIGVGPGAFNMSGSRNPMDVKVGDHVFFTEDYYITKVEGNVVIVDIEGILAVVRD
jgi:chaperonin GroES